MTRTDDKAVFIYPNVHPCRTAIAPGETVGHRQCYVREVFGRNGYTERLLGQGSGSAW